MQTQYGAAVYVKRRNTMTIISNECGYSGRLVQDVLFENNVGPIPFNYSIYFADNDPFNQKVSNLIIVEDYGYGKSPLEHSKGHDIYNVVNLGSEEKPCYVYDYFRNGRPLRRQSSLLRELRKECFYYGLVWANNSKVFGIEDYDLLMNPPDDS